MQDWITVRGNASGTVVLQPECDYIDFSHFQDFASYVEIADFSNATIKIQTAPLKEEAYFLLTDLVTVTPVAAGLAAVTVVRWSTGGVNPPARWLRWRCSGSAAGWSLTFRIHLNLNPAGSIL